MYLTEGDSLVSSQLLILKSPSKRRCRVGRPFLKSVMTYPHFDPALVASTSLAEAARILE